MTATIRRYGIFAFLTIMSLMMSISTVFAQEELEAAESGGSDGLMIAIIGFGALIVLGLGAAMNAQSKEEQAK